MSENQISKSKQKRLDQQKARKEQKKKKTMSVLTGILIPVVIIALAGLIVFLYKASQLDYGKYLNADGTIQAGDAQIDIDYKSMSFQRSDLLPDDETVENDITSTLTEHKYISENTDRIVESNDTVQIAYDAFLDGASYNSVSADNAIDLTIGSATLGSDVDDALLGQKAGAKVEASQTYADDYSDETLAGKTVTYEIHLLGIYDIPVFDDAFVQANLSDTASTAEEYRQSIIDGYYQDNLKSSVEEYIKDSLSVNQIPEKYINQLTEIYKAQNEEQYNYYNNMYYNYLGYYMYDSVYGMFGYDTEEDYLNYVKEQAEKDAAYALALESIYKSEGMTNTQDEIDAYFAAQATDDSSYSDMIAKYGKKYVAHIALDARVIEHLCDTVTITD